MNVMELRAVADNLFSKMLPLTSLRQEIADNFTRSGQISLCGARSGPTLPPT